MQNIVDMYSEKDLYEISRSIDKLNIIYDNTIIAETNITPMSENKNITRALEIYMKNLVLSTDMSEDIRLKNYKDVLQTTMKKDPTYVFKSELLKLPKERLSGIMSEETYNKFSNYKKKIESHCTNLYNKFINNEQISKEEKQLLMNFLCNTIGTANPEIHKMQENVIKNILNQEREKDYLDARFLVDFIANEESKEYGHEVVSNLIEFPEKNKRARGYASIYKVNVNADYAIKSLNSNNKEDAANLIHTICHEVAHTKQNYNIANGICNKETLDILTDKIFRGKLSKEDFAYYESNYYFEAGEKDAERKGYINADKYIGRYIEDDNEKAKLSNYLYSKKDHELYVDLISMRKDLTGEKFDADKFSIEKMEEVLKNDTSYLTKFPQYKQLYKDNGELKSFSERLIAYSNFKKSNKEDSNDIFISSFNYSLDNNDLNKIDYSGLNKEKVFKMMHALSDLYNTYSAMSHNVKESVKQANGFLTGERDIKDATQYRDKKVSTMASRYRKLESVLDVFYKKYGTEYSKIPEYEKDEFIYNKDKDYARHNFTRIKEERDKKELETMLQETKKSNILPEEIVSNR